MITSSFLFYFFAILSIVSATCVISSTNPIHSVLYLILVFCSSSGLLLLLQVEFLAMVFIMIYVGAIAVLFLFVVMMLNVRLVEFNINMLKYLPLGGIIALIFVFEIFLVINNELVESKSNIVGYINWSENIETITNIDSLGRLIYTEYFYLFLLAGMILLVAMIGAIVLTMYRRAQIKRQNIYSQVSRDFNKTIKFSH
uniref:NADH-ubiquinone oxidoreductase chain 6 n=1 Tax=Jakoba bahamiensis TaxID=221721 RepID=M4Q9P2_9EUKA|nr:NADH dehydrogenase subunit 6 [Jakoba bahamiensis]AGH24137.1 NADH dehydrogenase subunit 6 [Jakoba bahamiensis]